MTQGKPEPRTVHTDEVRIAETIRRLRTDQGLSLRDLATRATLSESYLSRVEHHKAALTIPNLKQVANALGVPMAFFFEEDQRSIPISLCRAGKGRKGVHLGHRDWVYEMLAADKSGKLMEPLLFDVPARVARLPIRKHPGDEFVYMLEGELQLSYGKEQIRLRKGDSFYYDATVPHTVHPVPGKRCRFLVVVSSRDYLFHGDLTRLLKNGASS